MVEVEMTKDIRDYEPKIFGLVTMRQIILLAIGLAISVPLFFILPIKDITARVMVAMIPMIPMIMMGWVSFYGMRLEQFALQMLRSLVLTPKKRKYKTESTIDYLKADRADNQKKRKEKIKVIKSAEYPGRK